MDEVETNTNTPAESSGAAAPESAAPEAAVPKSVAAVTAADRGRRNMLVGEVVSDKMHKSLRVRVMRLVRHVRYGKYVRRASVFKAHDEKNEARVGDKVSLFETRALSKTKRWKLARIVERAKV